MTNNILRKKTDVLNVDLKVGMSFNDYDITQGSIPPGNPRFASLRYYASEDLNPLRKKLRKSTPKALKYPFTKRVKAFINKFISF